MRALIALLLLAGPATAHGQGGAHPAWTFDPWILAPLLALGLPYAIGAARLRRRSRGGRAVLSRAVVFTAGWFSLALALVSPLHWFGERLLSVHMIEHEILMAVSAPLLVAARPLGVLLWGLPRPSRAASARLLRLAPLRASWRWTTGAAAATILHGIAIWGWHVPAVFDAAVANEGLHRLQHLSFLGTAVLFWWAMLWRSDRGLAAWHLFATMMHTAILGALMALAPRPLYALHPGPWSLTPLEDQQLAGLLMWIPAGIVYAGAALAMTALWILGSAGAPGGPTHAT
jgi:cytochrome c oxidase assembly factor CtaG